MNKEHNYLVVMAGGMGTRFWPLSRAAKPKQFLDILGTGPTLLQTTVERFSPLVSLEKVFIVTGKDYAHIVAEQLPDLPKSNILAEPMPKNTAPCVAWACQKIYKLDPEANIVVTPADHLILDNDLFVENIADSLEVTASQPIIATLGLVPTFPSTGYGYIQPEPDTKLGKLHKVKTFAEKPNIEMAEYFFNSGEFLWNSGIFIGQVETFLSAFRIHLEDVAEIFASLSAYFGSENEEQATVDSYFRSKSISMDYGVMEQAQNVFVLPCRFGWSDLGTWKSVYEVNSKDDNSNVVVGNAELYDTRNSIVHLDNKFVAVIKGLNGYIVAQHDGVILICPKDSEQDVKQFLYDVKERYGTDFS